MLAVEKVSVKISLWCELIQVDKNKPYAEI